MRCSRATGARLLARNGTRRKLEAFRSPHKLLGEGCRAAQRRRNAARKRLLRAAAAGRRANKLAELLCGAQISIKFSGRAKLAAAAAAIRRVRHEFARRHLRVLCSAESCARHLIEFRLDCIESARLAPVGSLGRATRCGAGTSHRALRAEDVLGRLRAVGGRLTSRRRRRRRQTISSAPKLEGGGASAKSGN